MNLRQLTSGTTWSLPEIRGHDIQVSPFFLLIVAFFVFAGLSSFSQLPYQLMWAPVLFFSVILHELGHAAASRRCGYGTSKIILHGFGGVAINKRGNTPPKNGMFIALAGPAVTLMLAAVFAGLYYGFQIGLQYPEATALTVIAHFLKLMMVANIFWFVVNLLPIYPLDGGQTLMHVFRQRGKSRSAATALSAKVSMVALGVTAVVALVVFQVGGIMLLVIFGVLGYMNWQILQRAKKGGGGGPGGPGVMYVRRR